MRRDAAHAHSKATRGSFIGVTVTCCVLVAFVALGLAVWPASLDAHTGPAIGYLASALSAVVGLITAAASAVAAFAAWRAARQSDETAQRSLEALGLAIAPKIRARITDLVDGEYSGPAFSFWNPTRWPAVDIDVDLTLADGSTESHRIERLEPNQERPDGTPIHPTMVRLPRRLPDYVRDPSWRDKASFKESAVLRYSDERSLIRWHVEFTQIYHHYPNGYGTEPAANWGRPRQLGPRSS